jgi:hypothetical protein
MKLDPKLTKHAVQLYPEYASYIESVGCLYTVMLKAMYRCVQSSVLWYETICCELKNYSMK